MLALVLPDSVKERVNRKIEKPTPTTTNNPKVDIIKSVDSSSSVLFLYRSTPDMKIVYKDSPGWNLPKNQLMLMYLNPAKISISLNAITNVAGITKAKVRRFRTN